MFVSFTAGNTLELKNILAPPPRPDLGWGIPPPGQTWDGVPPPPGQTWDGVLFPPPRNVNRQTPVKTVPSRHTTYAGGNKKVLLRDKRYTVHCVACLGERGKEGYPCPVWDSGGMGRGRERYSCPEGWRGGEGMGGVPLACPWGGRGEGGVPLSCLGYPLPSIASPPPPPWTDK